MVDLIIVCSVTIQNCFEVCLKESLERVGVPYKLVLTDPNLSFTESYNLILQTNMNDVKESKYLVFVAQDVHIGEQNWGQKIISVCDSLPDFGYGSIECRLGKQQIGYFANRKSNEPAIEVTTCDGAFVVIPSVVFLERQFDPQFKWYPVMEDYQCWIRLVKKLKVYHIPIYDYSNGGCSGPSKWVSQYKNITEYSTQLSIDHKRLLEKWGLKELVTTTWG